MISITPGRALGALLFLGLLGAPAEWLLKSSDHRNLSKAVADYYEAVQEKKDVQESLEKVMKQIESVNKRLKDTDVLTAVEDWEEVFRMVSAERLSGSLRIKKAAVTPARLSNQVDFDLAYWIPKDYEPKRNGAMPMLITVPAPGEKAAEHLDKYWGDAGLRDSTILIALPIQGDAGIWGAFGDGEAPGGIFQVMNALGALQREVHMDWNRIFLAGKDQGYSVVEAVAAAFPNLWAGVIALGDIPEPSTAHLGNFRNLPTLVLQPKADEAGGAAEEEVKSELASKIGELGFGNCTVEKGGAAQAAAWMQATRRNAYPSEITFSPVDNRATSAHWISLGPVEVAEGPRVEAKADRETNTITIDAQKVPSIVISLNDVLVDLGKPVRFVINGATTEQSVPRSAIEMIKDQSRAGDWGRIFVNRVSEDIP